jgi:hypothetical protein
MGRLWGVGECNIKVAAKNRQLRKETADNLLWHEHRPKIKSSEGRQTEMS